MSRPRRPFCMALLLCLAALICLIVHSRAATDETDETVVRTPLDEIENLLDRIPEEERDTIAIWDHSIRADAAARKAFVAAINNNSEIIELIESPALAARLEKFLRSDACYKASPGPYRHGAQLLCSAALAAHYEDSPDLIVDRLSAALRLIDTGSFSRAAVVQMSKTPIFGIASSTARDIYAERAVTQEQSFRLIDAFSKPNEGRKLLAAAEACWDIADGVRALDEYRLLYDFADDTDITTKAPLSVTELADLQRRDLEACARLKSRVMPAVTWPLYTLPKDDFWTGLLQRVEVENEAIAARTVRGMIAGMLNGTNRNLADEALLDLLLEIRLFEAEKGHLPASLEELARTLTGKGEMEYAWASSLLFIDPFSGKPLKYAVQAEDGKPSSFKLYSVGPDLEDDGGRRWVEARHYDIVVEGRCLAPPR